MTVATIAFIQEHKDLINENRFKELYDQEWDFDTMGEVTCALLVAGIDPLADMSMIPKRFLQGSNITEYSVPSHINIVGSCAFDECKELETVHLPEGLTFIDTAAFCESTLRNINIPSTVEYIGDDAFAATLIRNITIPDGVKLISKYCFEESALESIKFGAKVLDIQDRAFAGCKRLQFVDLNEGLRTIYDYAFADCPKLDSIYIPSSVTRIGSSAFYNTPVVIQCEEESYAHQYAEKHGIEYQLV